MTTTGHWTARELAEAVDGLAPVVLRTVTTLRIADLIGDDGLDLDELARRAGVDADRLGRLLDFLTCRGVFATGDGTDGTRWFTNTWTSTLLRSDHPAGLCGWLDRSGIGARMDTAVATLPDAMCSRSTAYELAFGRPFYADLADAPELGPSFDELRAVHGAGIATELVDAVDWGGATSVVDVGGGSGAVAEGLLRAYPRLGVTVVDLPDAVAGARERLDRAGLGGRAECVAAEIVGPLPRGADVYLLVNVLHNWDDRIAETILRRCSEAADEQGTTVVVERHSEREDPFTATAMDLRMLAFLGGRERSGPAYQQLAARVGLHPAGTRFLPGGLVALSFASRSARSNESTGDGQGHDS